jgi:hypothetical protein
MGERTMNCDACGERMPEYLEGGLPDSEVPILEAHVRGCAACRTELAETRDLLRLATRMPRRQPEAETVLRISARIHAAEGKARRTEFAPVMDLEELTQFLRVDRETVETYLDEIPCFELGGKLLFRRKSVEEWMERREMITGLQRPPSGRSVGFSLETSAKGGVSWMRSGRN